LSEMARMNATMRADERSAQGSVLGVEPEFAALQDIEIDADSRFINPSDVRERRRVVVLGRTLVTQLFPGVDPIGRHLTIKGSTYTVVGVLRPREGSRGFLNDERAFIPASTFRVLEGTNRIASIVYSPVSD